MTVSVGLVPRAHFQVTGPGRRKRFVAASVQADAPDGMSYFLDGYAVDEGYEK